MDFSNIIDRYEGIPVDMSTLSDWEKFAFQIFHDPKIISNPNMELTVQLDITAADLVYKANYSKAEGASLTAYLTWQIIQTFKAHKYFRYRMLDGTWYQFNNLPLFFPIAIGGPNRFYEAFIENVSKMGWDEFSAAYRQTIDRGMNDKPAFKPVPEEAWHVSTFIGNLPTLRFTSFNLHVPTAHTGRPCFYFGKRYKADARMHTPLYIMFDHSNLDPHVVGNFLEDYERNIGGS